MRVEILETAEVEFVDAVAYYNRESWGLGFEFPALLFVFLVVLPVSPVSIGFSNRPGTGNSKRPADRRNSLCGAPRVFLPVSP